jgi:mRNA interferase RelE/StbE
MKYQIELKPKAEKDLKDLNPTDRGRVVERLRWLEDDLHGDVKRLSNHFPEYRMRAGDYRALFEVAGDRVVVYRILHRRESYR